MEDSGPAPVVPRLPRVDEEGLSQQGRNSHDSSNSDMLSVSEVSQASTKSVSGSIFELSVENGRQYANTEYYMPNDDAEETRLSVVHQAFLLLFRNELTVARIPNDIKRVLDIGTGPGDWAIAMAERFTDAEIIATDISTYQQPPTVPPNVFFQIDDAREEWTYTLPFDVIHIRCLAGAFPDWSHIYTQVYKHLKPGGILEVMDVSLVRVAEPSTTSSLSIFNGAMQSAADRAGLPIEFDHLKKPLVESSGLSVLRTTSIEAPLGDYPTDPRMKMLGKMAMIATLEGLESRALRLLTREMHWDVDDVRSLCSKVVDEITRPAAHASLECKCLVARKLLELE